MGRDTISPQHPRSVPYFNSEIKLFLSLLLLQCGPRRRRALASHSVSEGMSVNASKASLESEERTGRAGSWVFSGGCEGSVGIANQPHLDGEGDGPHATLGRKHRIFAVYSQREARAIGDNTSAGDDRAT
jgi:hypothetical protein